MYTILNVACPLARVGEDAVGGAEQVAAHLAQAVVTAGHRSILVGARGSHVPGTVVEVVPPAGAITPGVRRLANEQQRTRISAVLAHERVDLVHIHSIDFADVLPPPGVPVLVTLHMPLGWYPPAALRPDRPATYLHCVSASQAATAPPDVPLLPTIANGVAVDRLTAHVRKHDYVMALGRICPEKGLHHALRAAHLADASLLLAGRAFPYPEHEQYFRRELAPLLDYRRRFIGPLGLERKRWLLAGARCLLVPSLAPETSSLVAMEALACGTPVIAFRTGALPEIIADGVTGFLVDDEIAMAEAIPAAANLDAEACRTAARERFSAQRMTAVYLALYERLINAPSIAPAEPANGLAA